jgi:hypothetical protein
LLQAAFSFAATTTATTTIAKVNSLHWQIQLATPL